MRKNLVDGLPRLGIIYDMLEAWVHWQGHAPKLLGPTTREERSTDKLDLETWNGLEPHKVTTLGQRLGTQNIYVSKR